MAVYKRVSRATGKTSWQAVIERRDPAIGERNRLTLGSYRLKKDAEKAVRDALTMRERGASVDPSKVTVAEVLEDWLRTKRTEVRPQTIAGYEIAIRKHIAPALGAVPVQKLSAAQLQKQYNAWNDAGVGARTIRTCHMRLSQALDQAMRHNLVTTNVCRSVRPPRDAP